MLGRWAKQLGDQASDVPSIFFFHNFLQNSLQKSFQFIFLFFHKFTKIKIKSFECPKSIRNYEKKIMLGTSDAWSISRSSHLPSLLYWRLSDFKPVLLTFWWRNHTSFIYWLEIWNQCSSVVVSHLIHVPRVVCSSPLTYIIIN